MQLQLEDLHELVEGAKKKGKYRKGEIPDSIAAAEAYRLEISGYAQLLADRAMCESIAQAMVLDRVAINALEAEEESDSRDNELAFRLAGQREMPATTAPKAETTSATTLKAVATSAATPKAATTSATTSKAATVSSNHGTNHNDNLDSVGKAESPKRAVGRANASIQKSCIACGDELQLSRTVICTKCREGYCHDCLSSLFEACTKDESMSTQTAPFVLRGC